MRYDRRRRRLVMPADPWLRLLGGRRAATFRRWVRSGLVPVRVRGGEVRLSFEASLASRAAALGLSVGYVNEANAASVYRTALEGLRRFEARFPGAAMLVPEPGAPPALCLAGEDKLSELLATTWPAAFVFRLSRRLRELQGWFDPAGAGAAAVVIPFAGVTR